MNYAGTFDATSSPDGSAAPSYKYIHIDHPPPHAPADAIIVPDAHFLFNADFKRSGLDLILSGDGRELVLHDYFKGEKRAALASPDGAHLTGKLVAALTGHVDVSQAGTGPAAGQVIGHVTKLQGTATAVRNGVSIILNNGDDVQKGDIVEAGSNSTLGITFIDGTVFGLAPNARMVLNEMVYDPNGSNNSTLFNLVAGTITFVAGQTAKHGDMKIDTPVATMGIRGTAVLVQIDFTVPGQAGTPNASFQVLVEPDGTTGSYVLFDKTTLQPIAMVNQAGQQTNINNGVISQTNAPLPPDVQKLIQDVFTQKFTENSNTKQSSPFSDTLNPLQQGLFIKTADGSTAVPTFVVLKDSADPTITNPNNPFLLHIPGPPTVVVTDPVGNVTKAFAFGEVAGITGNAAADSIGGTVRFADVNATDQPTVKIAFSSFTYKNAGNADVTSTLSPQQLADIAATEVNIAVTPAAGNTNVGSARWSYSVSDKAFDFLAAGEQLTLTYMVRVDNNYAANEATLVPITITITGTNDVPVITTSAQTIVLSRAASVAGQSPTSSDHSAGTLAFQDADLTDTHTVSTKLKGAVFSDGSEVPSSLLTPLEQALASSIATDSTGTGNGTIDWKFALSSLDDFVPKGETLTLTYTVTVADSQNATAMQTITVVITNPAEVWIAKSGSDGLWSDGANWQTGTAPTANDDVIIITDPQHGLTPSFPVTIDAPAVGKSVTMNDFGDSPPELINLNSLTIGTGGLNLAADSILHNSGTIDVAGATEILDHSVVVNSGKLDLQSGGDFADQSSITNTKAGTIEISGGTLNVQVDIANSGQIAVDPGATLALKASSIDGGMVTITGAPIDDNSDTTSSTPDGVLKLLGSSVLKNGSLDNTGQIKVSGGGNAFHDESVTANNALEILAGGALLLDLGTTIANAGGVVTVDSKATLTLNDATIDGGKVTMNGTLQLEGSSFLKNGSLDNSGKIDVNGGGNAFHKQTVTNTDTATIDVTSALTLDLGTRISGGTLNNFGTVHVETAAGATLDGVTVNNQAATIQIDDSLSPAPATLIVKDGTTIAGGELAIGICGTLEVSNDFGATLSGVNVDNCGVIQVDVDSVLTLSHATITGGTLTNNGTVHVTGDSSIGHDSFSNTQLTIDAAKTLTIDCTTIAGGTITVSGTLDTTGISAIDAADVMIGGDGVLEVVGGHLTIDCDGAEVGITNDGTLAVTGGELDITGETVTNDLGTVSAAAGSTLDLQNATIHGGIVNVDGTLDAGGNSAIDAANLTIADGGVLEVTGGHTTIDCDGADVGITNDGTLAVTGGELDITGETVTNDLGTVSAALGSTLALVNAIIHGGTVNIDGTLHASGNSAIDAADLTIAKGGVVDVTGGHLTIDCDGAEVGITNDGTLAVTGGELDIVGETVTNDLGTVSAAMGSTLALVDAIIKGGTIDVDGTLDASGNSEIGGAVIHNTGLVEVTDGTLTIDASSIVDNKGTFEADGGTLVVESALSGNVEIIGASTVELGADSVGAYSNLKITFADDSTGTLRIDHAETFSGAIAGLDDNAIDLADITWCAGATFSFCGNENGGILTIVSGGETVHLKLEGDYLGSSWNLTKDASGGGTDVTEAPGTISGLDAHGSAVEGQTVNVSITDGGAPVTKATYQWQLDGHDILGATGASYTPTEDAEGHVLTVNVSFTDTLGDPETSTISAGTVQESPTENASISLSGLNKDGNAVQGQQITASVTEADAPPSGIIYTWTIGGNVVKTGTDAGGATYTPSEADEGKAISVAVSFIDTHGFAEHGTASAGTVQEIPGGDLVATLDHLTAQQGVTIHVTQVTDGGIVVTSGLSYAWQVSSDGGQHWSTVGTSSSFTPGEAQEGKLLQLVVTYADASGSESSTYNLGMPNDLVATLDSTTAEQDVTIHVTSVKDGGSTVTTGVSYAWEVSSDGGQHWTTVGTNSSYTPTTAVTGELLQVVVTYHDPGETESTTDSLGIVTAAKEWKGGTHTWETAGQWSPSGVPTASDDVLISSAVINSDEHYTITVDQSAAVAHSLIENAATAKVDVINGGMLTLGGNLTITAGTFQIDAGGTLKEIAASSTITGSFTDNGTVEVAAGKTLEVASASVSGAGIFKIDSGATLQLDHANAHDVVFAGSGELILKDPTHFTGTVSDSSGSMTAQDVLDLAGYDASASVSYSGTTKGGTITVSEAGHATAHIHVGANSTNWSAPVSDGHGGIMIHDPPADGGAPAPDDTANVAQSAPQASNGLLPAGFGHVMAADGFVFKPNMGRELIADFATGSDLMQIEHSMFANVAALSAHDAAQSHTVVVPEVGGSIMQDNLLKGLFAAHHGDFHFV